jgi:hypothetical protein
MYLIETAQELQTEMNQELLDTMHTTELDRLGSVLQFQDHRMRYARFLNAMPPALFPQDCESLVPFLTAAHHSQTCLRQKSTLWPVRNDFAVIQTACQFVQSDSVATEILFEYGISRLRNCFTVFTPIFSSLSPVTLPTPGRRPTCNA